MSGISNSSLNLLLVHAKKAYLKMLLQPWSNCDPSGHCRQVSEAQRELQLVTDSMVSKVSTENEECVAENIPEPAPQADNRGGMDDLFRYVLQELDGKSYSFES